MEPQAATMQRLTRDREPQGVPIRMSNRQGGCGTSRRESGSGAAERDRRTYVDSGGLNPRADIAGLNLVQFASNYADAVVAVSRAPRSRLPALDFLLEVVQHLALNLAQPQRRNVCSKNPPMPPAVPRSLDRDRRVGARRASVAIVELASFSITVCPATSTFTLTSRTRDMVACSFHVATVPAPCPPSSSR